MQIVTFREIYSALLTNGKKIFPRGEEVIELADFRVTFEPYSRFINFKSRKLNLNYIKKEFLWYLKGDKYDTSITSYAKMWKNFIKEDGSINSNYGQYIFSKELPQFLNVAKILLDDKDSRRASIVILQPYHLLSDSGDFPCTYGLNFKVRDDKLNMTVHMRSQDAVYGLGNDLPTFSFIHEMLYVYLRDSKYHNLQYGDYTHLVDSFHIYKKHYKIAEEIAFNDDEYIYIDCPKISTVQEVKALIITLSYPFFKFSSWLNKCYD